MSDLHATLFCNVLYRIIRRSYLEIWVEISIPMISTSYPPRRFLFSFKQNIMRHVLKSATVAYTHAEMWKAVLKSATVASTHAEMWKAVLKSATVAYTHAEMWKALFV